MESSQELIFDGANKRSAAAEDTTSRSRIASEAVATCTLTAFAAHSESEQRSKDETHRNTECKHRSKWIAA
jgi:hypothetical protein